MTELLSDVRCNGVMGVPITFLDKYNPEQFEILGITLGNTVDYEMTAIFQNAVQHNKNGTIQGGSKVNTRAAICVKDKPTGRKVPCKRRKFGRKVRCKQQKFGENLR